jgi:hypothetical protein
MANVFLEAYGFMMEVFTASYNCKKPNADGVKAIMERLREIIGKLNKKRSRKFKYYNELDSFKNGLGCTFWVISPKPGQTIKGSAESC